MTVKRATRVKPAAEKQPAADLVLVRFACEHRHAGREYAAGDEISVDAATFELLEQFGAIEPVAAR